MAQEPTEQTRLPSQESLLLDYIHRLESHREGRQAVHVHLSGLKAENRRDHHVRMAANTFDPLVKMLSGQLFVLKNSDLFFIYKGDVRADVKTSILKIRFLFSDDPLVDGAEAGPFNSFYDVERDFEEILNLVRTLVHEESAEQGDEEGGTPEGITKSAMLSRKERGEPLTPRALGRVEQALQRADLSNLVRRQFICALIGEAAPQPLFSELFISIKDLRETLMPDIDLGASRWLFQHLTETLDRRVLAMLSKSTDRSITGEVSVNLNLSTLLSQEFMKFDDSVIAALRGSIVVELQIVDIFADLNAYLFARDFVKERDYRICIDGLTHQTLPFIHRDKLGADMVKLIWNTDLKEQVTVEELGAMVKSVGDSRVVLCRCDDNEAVEFGQAIGISMFQGRHIENLLADENRRREMGISRAGMVNAEIVE